MTRLVDLHNEFSSKFNDVNTVDMANKTVI
jgi:hypothetical protein